MIKILKEIIIVGGLVLFYILGYWMLNPGKTRMIRKAQKLHKKGEQYYLEGDLELAEEYYEEADIMRKVVQESA